MKLVLIIYLFFFRYNKISRTSRYSFFFCMTSNIKRLKSLSISVPILYGNKATKLTAENLRSISSPDHTHKWTVFFKPVLDYVNLTPLIKKVTFKLHETYENPIRTVEKPPFEVTETGWGEFEIIIKIHFHSNQELGINEKNLQIFHSLKLHSYIPQQDPDSDVFSVLYDEMIFQEPTEKVFEILTQKPVNLLPYTLSNPSKRYQEYVRSDEVEELAKLDLFIEKIKKKIEDEYILYNELNQKKLALIND